MVKIVFGEWMNSQMSIFGIGGELSPSSVIQIISGFHLVNTSFATCDYFLWDEAVGKGLNISLIVEIKNSWRFFSIT
jgi:hypothetical protein